MKKYSFIAAFLFLIALALEGLWRVAPATFWSDFSHKLYLTLQLFVLEGDWTYQMDHTPWEIRVVRYLAPLSMILSLVLVFARDSWRTLSNYFIRFRKGHVVIVGLGDKGWNFARSCLASETRAVFIEVDRDNPLIERVIVDGFPVIVGDSLDESVLRRAALHHASDLIALTGSDSGNIEIALRAKRFVAMRRHNQKSALRIHVYVSDFHLSNHFEEHPRFFSSYEVAEVSFFDSHELAARQLLSNHHLDMYADAFGRKQAHVVILGYNKFAEQMVIQIARSCWFANGLPPRITVVDAGVGQKTIDLGKVNEGIVRFFDLEQNGPSADKKWMSDKTLLAALRDVTTYIVCFADVEQGLKHALRLRGSTLQHKELNAPILLRMEKSSGLAELLEAKDAEPQVPNGIIPFGMLEEVLSIENVVGHQLDAVARTLHESYLRSNAPVGNAPSAQPWSRLPEVYRKENRFEGDHLAAKLRSIGCVAGPVTADPIRFNDEETGLLARMEKQRWNASKSISGWQYGAERNDAARLNPLLVEWDALSASQQAIEKSQIAELPDVLRDLGSISIIRQKTLAIVADNVELTADVIADFRQHIEAFRSKHSSADILLSSSLREGAERRLTKLAMEILNAKLRIVLPLPYEMYQQQIVGCDALTRDASLEEFEHLVGVSTRYFEIPLRFNETEQGIAKQNALANAFLYQRSNALLAVCDSDQHDGIASMKQLRHWVKNGFPEEFCFPGDLYPLLKPADPMLIRVE